MFATPLHWVAGIEPHRLALSARPRGGDDLAEEVAAWQAAGVEEAAVAGWAGLEPDVRLLVVNHAR